MLAKKLLAPAKLSTTPSARYWGTRNIVDGNPAVTQVEFHTTEGVMDTSQIDDSSLIFGLDEQSAGIGRWTDGDISAEHDMGGNTNFYYDIGDSASIVYIRIAFTRSAELDQMGLTVIYSDDTANWIQSDEISLTQSDKYLFTNENYIEIPFQEGN